MCGINGIIDFYRDVDCTVIERMNDSIAHRGPDGRGSYLSPDRTCGFGHVRLSIIDVAGSKQPLCNEDQTVWITFNGEIYNYQPLRKKLLDYGHQFKTNGDTEVLVHMYEQYGREMLKHLNGMFAFAIWDTKKRSLFIARDRMGIKPLNYFHNSDKFIFSSEQKAILKNPDVDVQPSQEGIFHYLTYRSAPAPFTLFKGIKKLLPGHYLYLTENNLEIKKYWEIPLNKPQQKIKYADAIMETERILTTSIKRRMISDVPLGAFLSGGVDSSLIVALMSKMIDQPVKTFSVGFENFASNEAPYAKIVADQYKTDHHELILKEEKFLDHLEQLTSIRDAPLSEPADIPLHLLSKMAREKVKVLLSGEGSDELFAGYPKFRFDGKSGCVNWLPKPIKNAIINLIPSKYRKIEVALKSMFESDYADRWPLWFSPFSVDEKLKLMGSDNDFENPTRNHIQQFNLEPSLSSFLFCDCKIWLPDNLLDRGDRMTMAAGIEGRVPFLDHDLVEYAFTLPDGCKINGSHQKYMIKQIALKYLPDKIVNRRKAGFVMPLAMWFRGKLRDYCYDTICCDDYIPTQMISKQYRTEILDKHCSGKKDYYLQIWTLLGLALWYKNLTSYEK